MSNKPELTVIEGGKVELVEIPERKDFDCWKCGRTCVLWPKANPPFIQHSVPGCDEWARIEARTEDLERFAIKCGVEMLIAAPKAEN